MRGIVGVLLLGAVSAAYGGALPPVIHRVLTGHGIPPDDVSILVQPVDSPEPILSHLVDVPRNPASVMKLVTTWSALEILGPAYRWPTEVYFLGDFDGESLDGDLAIKGYGDPFLVVEEFWKMLRALRRLGLEDIGGDLLLDDSYFHVVERAPGAFDDQPYRTYNVVPNALLVNFKAVRFEFFMDVKDGSIDVASNPLLSNLDIRNRIGAADGPCRGYQAGISFHVTDASLSEVTFEGAFPRSCGSYALSRSVLHHDTYAFGLFQTLWKQIGGAFRGDLVSGAVPADARPAFTWHSPPLANVIRSINKYSNNVMTRQLLYTLGADQLEPPGTRAKGVEAVLGFLAARGLGADSLVIDNGAGLSREGRVTARFLSDLLRTAADSTYAAEFISSLSLAGLDGTTRSRFNGRARGRMHVKSGRLNDVSALAGYVHAAGGADYVVAVLLNTEDAHRGPGKELQRAVVRWVHRQL